MIPLGAAEWGYFEDTGADTGPTGLREELLMTGLRDDRWVGLWVGLRDGLRDETFLCRDVAAMAAVAASVKDGLGDVVILSLDGGGMGLKPLEERALAGGKLTGELEGLGLFPRLGDFDKERKYSLAGFGLVLLPRSDSACDVLSADSASAFVSM